MLAHMPSQPFRRIKIALEPEQPATPLASRLVKHIDTFSGLGGLSASRMLSDSGHLVGVAGAPVQACHCRPLALKTDVAAIRLAVFWDMVGIPVVFQVRMGALRVVGPHVHDFR